MSPVSACSFLSTAFGINNYWEIYQEGNISTAGNGSLLISQNLTLSKPKMRFSIPVREHHVVCYRRC
jgi:hypothetical protein